MPWNDNELSADQIALRNMISKLSEIRNDYRNLSRGRRLTLSSNQDTWVYQMLGCGGDSPSVTVMLNRADEARDADLPAGNYTDQLNGESLSGGRITLPARSIRVLIPAE